MGFDFLCRLAEIFASFLGFLLGFLKDFIGNLQRDLGELFGLDFCSFFFFFWVSISLKGIFFFFFL